MRKVVKVLAAASAVSFVLCAAAVATCPVRHISGPVMLIIAAAIAAAAYVLNRRG